MENNKTPTKDQQAQEYAEKQRLYAAISGDGTSVLYTPKQFVNAYLDGYTACEQSMWRSVEEEMPCNEADILVSDGNGLHIASYFNGEWDSTDDEFTRNPQMWMPIPPIPDTNTEKK